MVELRYETAAAPIPSQLEVIQRDVNRLRHLTPPERLQAMLAFLEEGERLMQDSPARAAARRIRETERAQLREQFRNLCKKHGC
jgi:hypothetical protein